MAIFNLIGENDIKSSSKIYSITTGLVKENWDSKHPGMVKIEFFLGEEGKNLTSWVPIMTPYGGKDFGYYALPEIGTVVVVAFYLGDRSCPIVLGSLWNEVNIIPKEIANENNTVKCFKTKGGCEIIFAEEEGKEKIEIYTPKDLKISLQEEKKLITIQDKEEKNMLKIDSQNNEVTLMADKKISFLAGGKEMLTLDKTTDTITMKAGKIEGKADQTMNLKGQNMQVSGGMVEIKGDSSVKVNSNGILQVKGNMVKIN